jgi:hypothetical protein
MTRRTRQVQVAAVLALAAVIAGGTAAPVLAHHSFAMYNMQETRTMTGKLTRFIPGSNHAQLIFEVIGPDGTPALKDGKPLVWGVEMGSAAAIARSGVTVDAFPVGTIMTVSLHPLRDGRPFGAIGGALIKCGNAVPSGGCNEKTGQVMMAPAN